MHFYRAGKCSTQITAEISWFSHFLALGDERRRCLSCYWWVVRPLLWNGTKSWLNQYSCITWAYLSLHPHFQHWSVLRAHALALFLPSIQGCEGEQNMYSHLFRFIVACFEQKSFEGFCAPEMGLFCHGVGESIWSLLCDAMGDLFCMCDFAWVGSPPFSFSLDASMNSFLFSVKLRWRLLKECFNHWW